MTTVLPAAAIIQAHENNWEYAVEILGLTFHHPASAKHWLEQWPLLTHLRAQLESKLSFDIYTAAWERGKALDLNSVVVEIVSSGARR